MKRTSDGVTERLLFISFLVQAETTFNSEEERGVEGSNIKCKSFKKQLRENNNWKPTTGRQPLAGRLLG